MTARFDVRPSSVLAGAFVVVNADEPDRVARQNGRPLIFLDAGEAAKSALRLNNRVGRRRVCRLCRHLAPLDEVVDGRCRTCAGA